MTQAEMEKKTLKICENAVKELEENCDSEKDHFYVIED